MRRLRG